MEGKIYSINVKPFALGEKGLPKKAIEMAFIGVRGVGGDFNYYRNEKKNGDLRRAISLYPYEMLEQLRVEGFPIEPGHLGENITTRGVPYDFFVVGEKYRFGDEVVVEISEPILPCRNLKLLPYFHEVNVKKLLKDRRGWYARVIKEGDIQMKDFIERVEG